MADPTQNSRNPANGDSLAGALKEVMRKFLQGDIDHMLPAQVIAYDRETNRATVRPLIRIQRTDGTLLDRAEISSVPVLQMGAGNAVLTFPLAPGDIGWLQANDRDISLFLQTETDSAPNTIRMHDFGDSVFIPDQFKRWTLDPVDTENAVFQTLDGAQRIALFPDHIEITSDGFLQVNAPQTNINGFLVVAGAGILNLGASALVGAVTSNVNFSVGGKSLVGHNHTQGNDSAGDVQVPTNNL